MRVIGTAGHIDHGKSTLIRALTGMDPDRLKEEKERGLTIDLGFAWLTLPSGREVGIVDVPGHHRFVKNMLAGAAGIDLVLFVVAASEGWMPQSQEHLAIIDLLGIGAGVVALTKADLVDEEWLEMVAADVRERLAGTVLADAPMVPVAAPAGRGLNELVAALDGALAQSAPPPDRGRPRLWVDRVFTIRGAGTVVTGTLHGGTLAVEDEVRVLPRGLAARVRGLQTHKRSVPRAQPGTRFAVNLAGVEREFLGRGDAVCAGPWRTTQNVHGELRALAGLDRELQETGTLKVYIGSAEIVARYRLLGEEALFPGEKALVQLELAEPTVAEFGDRFIVRDPARQETVGGGRILDPAAPRVRGRSLRLAAAARAPAGGPRAPRLRLELLRLRAGAAGPAELLPVLLEARGVLSRAELAAELPLSARDVDAAVEAAVAAGKAVTLPSFAAAPGYLETLAERIAQRLADHHRRYPLRPGMPRETLRSGLGLEPRLFDEVVGWLVAAGRLAETGADLHLAGHRVRLDPRQEEAARRLLALLKENPYAPPTWDDLQARHGFDLELLAALVEQGRLVRVGKALVFPRETIAEVQARVRAHIEEQGSIDVAQVRDMFATSRKYALPLLEHFDETGFTRRVGDVRVLGPAARGEGSA